MQGSCGESTGSLRAVPSPQASVTQPQHGTVTVQPNGSLVYTPPLHFNGTVTFDYTVSDGLGGTDTATVTIVVTRGCCGKAHRRSGDRGVLVCGQGSTAPPPPTV